MGGSKAGGSMPLPRICGFDEGFFFAHKLTLDDEHRMFSMLGSKRFQKGNRAARCYANLVVLFRLLLFHSPLIDDARFWGWIATDWGIVDGNRALVSEIANFYSDARYAELLGRSEQKRLSLLVRLVDEWLLIRPRPEISFSKTIDDARIHATRSAWLNIRDHHVDMLMDAKLPGCLAGVELPAKIVTSLWETDPEVAALLKEMKTTRRPKTFANKFKPPQTENAHPHSTSSEGQRKRKVSLSEGEIDEDHPYKRNQFVRGDHVLETYPAESGETFDLLDFTAAARRAPLPSYEQFQQPVSTKPSPAHEPAEQFLSKSAPASVQSTLSQGASGGRINDNSAVTSNQREELNAQLRRVASQTKRRRDELHTRVEAETTGYVPLPSHPDGNGSPILEVGGGLLASEREMYESRLHEMEERMEVLERALQHESSWARAMGQFLYDANGKSVRSLQDVFSAIDALQKTSSALLDKTQQGEE
ncbi:hypothetical protein LMH87_010340 [Akanthomyces muscarius]|uniref:Uncharacterized protein n=1 Tax=Akanthomyces muscarius TaxID=2231603 RepID=A0A9W8QDT3_AKAMU|nr:hypothetical protein LMH87_010340 [Akanthomyces muscarius]KAJ4153872.1 hypothetical protein LMH87_010340 [Akanthomyces muscarius]